MKKLAMVLAVAFTMGLAASSVSASPKDNNKKAKTEVTAKASDNKTCSKKDGKACCAKCSKAETPAKSK